MSVGTYSTLPLPREFNQAAYIFEDALAKGRGNKTAVYCGDETYTFNDLIALVNRAGNALKELCVEREQRVLVILRDSPEWLASWLGAVKIGAVATHAYSYLLPEDYGYFLNYVRPKVVVVDETTLDRVREARKYARYPVTLLVKGRSALNVNDREYDFDAMTASASPLLDAEPTSRDDIAVWNWSGGTTGKPKAVPHMHHSFPVAFESTRSIVGYNEADVMLNVPKLFFHFAHNLGANFPLRAGGAVVLFPERTTPQIVFRLVKKHNVTLLLNVPTMMRAMLRTAREERADLSSVRMSICGGEALSEQLYNEWMATFGVDIVDVIGSAESNLGYIINRPGQKAPGSVGKVVPFVEAKIVDEEGHEVEKGEQGLLCIHADTVGTGYHLDHEKAKRTFLGNDWLNTGDIFRQDEDDNFYFVGRGDDLIKVSGVWISPLEMEMQIQKHEDVKECAVLGVPDTDGLLKTKAYVVLVEGVNGSEALKAALTAFCKERLAPHKYPRAIEFLPELPKTGQGKIDRRRLLKEGR